MVSKLSPLEMQRLAYIRFLYEEGAEYARRPHPLSCTAVLMLHDAVENFLGMATDHHGTNPDPKIQFMQYWSELKAKAQIDLPGKGAMTGLNAARVALKHHGTFPSEQTIEGAVRDVLRFFMTASPIVFGVDFDKVDMVDLLTQPETRQFLRDAQTHADIGDYSMAMAGLVLAFDALLTYYAKGDKPAGTSPFRFGPPMSPLDEPRVDGHNGRGNSRLKKMTEIAKATQEALRVISLGIDYPSVARFRVIAPRVDGYANGSHRFVNSKSVQALTAEEYDWARHFVIESALRASRADQVRQLQERAFELNWNPSLPYGERTWTGPVNPSVHEVSAFEDEMRPE